MTSRQVVDGISVYSVDVRIMWIEGFQMLAVTPLSGETSENKIRFIMQYKMDSETTKLYREVHVHQEGTSKTEKIKFKRVYQLRLLCMYIS